LAEAQRADALHAVLCTAGFNIRWLLRTIARGGIAALLFAMLGLRLVFGHIAAAAMQVHARRDRFVAA
jgi:IS5 family transposase